ncbi:MAG: replicative DNA helicase [Dehalococcoidia bacterium]|nr:replicative DNA helicase [Dehalococcoidia bacterium]
MVTDKLPPYDTDAEEAVVGSLLIDSDCMVRIGGLIKPGDFFREQNQWVFEACLSLYERNEAINQITVAHELTHRDKLEMVGGAAYLAYLVSVVPTSLHADFYAQIVQRTSLMRRLIQAAGQIAALGYDGGPDIEGTLGKAEELLFGLRQGRSSRDFVHIREVLEQYLEELTVAAMPVAGELLRVPTGFTELDKLLGGLHKSDLVILAARPSMGKTSLVLNIAETAAVQHGARVAIFSLEMSKEQLAHRLISSRAGVDLQRLRLEHLADAENRRVMDAVGVLSESPIYIDDSPGLRVVEMRSKARRLANQHGLDLIVVDYLQLIHGSGRGDNRVLEISEISRTLKSLARELNVPVLAAAQLSRAVETRTPHIPILSDLRESGSIEQDADVVMFIYREDVYVDEDEWMRKNPSKPYPKGIADIIVAKHRNGPTGQISLIFFEKLTRFSNLELYRNEG